mmetsp:Transcript_21590/g.64892  ORF Transcript_21590/g.64892 Transcript_21590/m.64892 type:complete len:891 (-) Transcript_21590:41-2713(-)|eukprot:CAMPEP_0175559654 /NCGR_PEP_ID=MMETSP0096-20121207/36511_1 /TAXON_ID=311494 /ORGANISM="Alexandrium monilatum, Strain CCMP3105" /LENGTH=890 /DNA_ID=CAMNT_0016862859 /DNA_START=25 /DNA_END=2697 /DNA_ORIENTATION=+
MDFDLDELDAEDPADFIEAGTGGESPESKDFAPKPVESISTFVSSDVKQLLDEKGLLNKEETRAVEGMLQRAMYLRSTSDMMREWCSTRFTAERWLDENEREWFALDRLIRSRPWATNKDTPFPYPFREATNQMRKAEGPWVGDNQYRPKDTRGKVPYEVVTQVHFPREFPPAHRVVMFCPEFGSEQSFSSDAWKSIKPADSVDIWTVCWQGWNDFKEMIEQVTLKVCSFADGVNTVWYGQGMGALVAFEIIKFMEAAGMQNPCLPVAFVVSDCPAPHLFADAYKPYEASDWNARVLKYSAEAQGRVAGTVSMMRGYKYTHAKAQAVLHIPVRACYHSGDALAPISSVAEWARYAVNDDFASVDLGPAKEHKAYLAGQGYGLQPEPKLLDTISAAAEKYDRWHEDAKLPDIGDVDGPVPEKVDTVVVGAGISGVCMAKELHKSGQNVICLDRYHAIGGVWEFYGNDYSRVNTSEIGYRIVDKTGSWRRPNEDHTPKRDIMKDMYTVAAECKGCIRCNINVEKVDKKPDGTFEVHVKHVKTGVETIIKANAVSFHVNRRIGKRREVDWENSKAFKGEIRYGYGNEVKDLDFWGKEVLVVGAGAFAFENVRTALEHGASHVTLLGRRDGTTSPKWVDMISFLRPLDVHLATNKSGNMISFECWQKCYLDAGLKTPKCWDEGLLKPNNHTVSVSDLAFIAGFHGMFSLHVGEIASVVPDGTAVELKDGSRINCQIILKCTGFLLNDEVQKISGYNKMHPYGLMDFNLNYLAEPLLDGGQFSSGKDKTETNVDDMGFTWEDYFKGLEVFKAMGFNEKHMQPMANPFGSGQGGPIDFQSKYFAWLLENPDIQQAMLSKGGKPEQDVTVLWASQIGQYQHLTTQRLIASLAQLIPK